MFDVPILMITFSRPDTTEKVFQAVRQVKPKRLFIAANAPRPEKPGEVERSNEVRKIASRVDWDCEVKTRFLDKHLMAKDSLSSAITWFFENVEEGIIFEDDTVPHPSFFPFCKELLERYRHDTRIAMISGDNFLGGWNRTDYSYYFSHFTHIWGWASWRRAWKHFDVNMPLWPEIKKGNWLRDLMGNDECVRYWTEIIDRTYANGIDTWDYQFSLAMWANSMLTILPSKNMVSNIGFRPDATNTSGDSPFANMATFEMTFPLIHPPFVIRDTLSDRIAENRVFGISVPVPEVPGVSSHASSNEAATQITKVIEYAISELNAGSYGNAIQALNEAKKFQNPVRDLEHARAFCFIAMNSLGDAREALNAELSTFPDNEPARALLQQVVEQEAKKASN